MTHVMKKGDTGPSLLKQCQDEDGAGLDLTGATATFSMRAGSSLIIDHRPAVIFVGQLPNGLVVTQADGWIEYVWQSGDTNTVGVYESEFKITFSDGTIETVPNEGFEQITINENI